VIGRRDIFTMNLPEICPAPLSRREFSRALSIALGGVFLHDVDRARAASPTSRVANDTAVILIWLPGGPPHLDMYDMKPEAPLDYRGEFRPIATSVPGLEVCELMPWHARIGDRFCIIRSISHEFADHGGGHKRFLTGRVPKEPTGFVNDHPAVGSIVAKMRDHSRVGVPNYIAGTDPGRNDPDVFSFGAAYLGPSYMPFTVVGDPGGATFKVPNIAPLAEVAGRFDDRTRLLQFLDRLKRDLDRQRIDSVDRSRQQALELISSVRARNAFDLTREPAAVRDRYGRHCWGQRALLARRLVESGCSFVTMVLENPYQSGVPWLSDGTYNWDSHAVNCHIFNDLKVRLPIYDQAVTALVDDLHARGLDKRVMVVVTGEFGRTPRLESQVGTQTHVLQPGRNHWPQAMSMLVAGGGMRTGQVIGATDRRGEHPKDRHLTPNDLWATVYRHLGIDPRLSFPDSHGRPLPILPFGQPIAELI
jgi:hypothetical protein